MLRWETVSFAFLVASVVVVCVCAHSSKQWLFPIQPEVMRQCGAPAECNEAPYSSTLPHQVFLCLSTQQACVYTAPRFATKPNLSKHAHMCVQSPPCFLFKCLLYYVSICSPGFFRLFHSSCSFSSPLIASTLCPQPLLFLLSPLSAGVLGNWAVVNSTLAWISSVATSG